MGRNAWSRGVGRQMVEPAALCAIKLGAIGRAAVRMLGRQRRLEAIPENYERELSARSH